MAAKDRADNFHEGQVWSSSRGTMYRVESVERGGKASLILGFNGEGKRRVKRDWDAVAGWSLKFDPEDDAQDNAP